MSGCLAGLKVLDLTRILAGPWATQPLADLGADVIKIERPGQGDDTRAWGPPFVTCGGVDPFSAYYLAANRGKQSVVVDIGKPEGQSIVSALAASCDVVVENFKVGGLKRHGLDYPALSGANPGLVYCSISGFGQTGTYKDRPGYDLMVQAMGGLMSITGEPGGEPMKAGVAVADIFTGLYAVVAILAALNERRTSGLGQHIDLSLLDVQVATLANQGINYLASGKAPARHGNAHPDIVPYQAFAASDGHVVVAVGNDAQFASFASILGRPELATDTRFARNADRAANRGELVPLLAGLVGKIAKADLLGALDEAFIPAGPINTIDQVFGDPRVRARGQVIEQPLVPGGRSVRMVGNPIRFSRTPIRYRMALPALGAQTLTVLNREIGMPPGEITRLERKCVIGTRDA